MKLISLVLLLGVSTGSFATVVRPVTCTVGAVKSESSIGMQIRAWALNSNVKGSEKNRMYIARQFLGLTGYEIDRAEPYFFFRDMDMRGVLRKLEDVEAVGEGLLDKNEVKALRKLLIENNLYNQGFNKISAEDFAAATQAARIHVVRGLPSFRWFETEEVDSKGFQLPKEIFGFYLEDQIELKNVKIKSVEALVSSSKVIAYHAIYSASNGVKFDYFFDSEKRPLPGQEIML